MTTPILDLLHRVYTNGTTLTLTDDGRLNVEGEPAPDDLMAELKARKPEVLATLREHRIGELDADYWSDVPRTYVTPPDCLAERACARLGPCSQFLMRRARGQSMT